MSAVKYCLFICSQFCDISFYVYLRISAAVSQKSVGSYTYFMFAVFPFYYYSLSYATTSFSHQHLYESIYFFTCSVCTDLSVYFYIAVYTSTLLVFTLL